VPRRLRRFASLALGASLFAVSAASPPAASALVTQFNYTGAGAGSHLAGGDGGVLVVGDSLEVLTGPYLRRYLPGIPLTVRAVGGYNSFQIFDLFRKNYRPSQSVIVFDAGTNDDPEYPQILAGNLRKITAIIGRRCVVLPSIHGLSVNGVNSAGKNRVVHGFAASRPGTQVPAWAHFVATHPELMQSDHLHPIAQGADARAQLIAQGVQGCLVPPLPSAPDPPAPSRPAPAARAPATPETVVKVQPRTPAKPVSPVPAALDGATRRLAATILELTAHVP
jgi:hypothetical protein